MKIRFSSDILRRLGEELNPSMDKGILELVKNAYDADAIHCTISLENTEETGGTILIVDDGDGMTPDEIENGWLVLGRSTKNQKTRTKLERIPAGSKGLGRLAALRMGDRTLLTTRPRGKMAEYNLLIDWKEFDEVDLVDDVELNIEKTRLSQGSNNGTEIRIENIQLRIGMREVKRLARELILLAGPFGDDPTGFKPVLKAPEFRDLENLVGNRYFNEADYHLVATVDGKGIASAKVIDWRDAVLFAVDHGELVTDTGRNKFECPPLTFDLWTFLLSKDSFRAKAVPVTHVRDWLQNFGGVHIYQNGLRVTPYGDPGNDWLDMNLRRVRSPEERPSTNNSIGRVVFDDTDSLIVQKTDRSGFIESDAFLEIREFGQIALDWMARRRLEEAEKRREHEKKEVRQKATESRKNLDVVIEKLPRKEREPIQKAVAHAWQTVDKQFRQYEGEIQLYRTLSTAGITSATFAHESAGNPIKVIGRSASTLRRRGQKYAPEIYDEHLSKPIEAIVGATKSLSVLGDATLKLLDHEKRRAGRVDIHEVIGNVLSTYRPFLDTADIKVEKELCEGSPFLRGSEAAIESIITNLLNNSVAAFERSNKMDRRINLTTQLFVGFVIIRVTDSGPGIQGIEKREIWLPGRTTRKNGTGLGLTIVRDTVQDLGGEVGASEHSELGGAEIVVKLPILGT
jgi:signal transduction histidine kinase